MSCIVGSRVSRRQMSRELVKAMFIFMKNYENSLDRDKPRIWEYRNDDGRLWREYCCFVIVKVVCGGVVQWGSTIPLKLQPTRRVDPGVAIQIVGAPPQNHKDCPSVPNRTTASKGLGFNRNCDLTVNIDVPVTLRRFVRSYYLRVLVSSRGRQTAHFSRKATETVLPFSLQHFPYLSRSQVEFLAKQSNSPAKHFRALIRRTTKSWKIFFVG